MNSQNVSYIQTSDSHCTHTHAYVKMLFCLRGKKVTEKWLLLIVVGYGLAIHQVRAVLLLCGVLVVRCSSVSYAA